MRSLDKIRAHTLKHCSAINVGRVVNQAQNKTHLFELREAKSNSRITKFQFIL
jgi:hypothetical protein